MILVIEGKEIMKAHADITGENINGEAHFTEIEHGTQRLVKVHITIEGDPLVFTPGLHGVHIHERGICEAPDFMSAGGHFDPGPASDTDPDVNHPYHMGDLPNIEIREDGSGELEAITDRVTLTEGPLCILSGEGTAIMIHGKHDSRIPGEHKSGVSGGPRLACGVIRMVK
ncbi:MAG: superoxide dismutase family protein [Armatimonadetes bacterium]|nr:MAG: superoxide dismutase family protein [Armatimonadota bacterium]